MPDTKLAAELRSDRGSRPAGRLRREGQPARASSTASATTRSRSRCQGAASSAASSPRSTGANTLITLQIDGSDELALARQVQRDAVKGTLIHVDFVRVRADQTIQAEVRLNLLGQPEGVSQGGMLEQLMHSLTVEGLPGQLPTEIEHDVTALVLGDQLHVGDVQLPAGVDRHQRGRRAHRHDLGSPWSRRRRGRSCVAEGEEGAEARRGRRGRSAPAARPRTPARTGVGSASCCGAERVRRSAPARPPICSWSGSAIPARSTRARRHNVGPRWSSSSRGATAAGCARARSARDGRRGARGREAARARDSDHVHERLRAGGRAARAPVRREPEHLVIVHDELDLPSPRCCAIKSVAGSPATTACARSSSTCTTTRSCAVRIGVGKPDSKEQGADHVLSRFGEARPRADGGHDRRSRRRGGADPRRRRRRRDESLQRAPGEA